jgi:integrase
MLLTFEIVRAARPRERRYVLCDGQGLSLHVMPWGSKWWRFRYHFRRAERMISLGVYPRVNLATARRRLADARGLLARGIDPGADRRQHRIATARTFESVAREWLKGLEVPVAKGLVTSDTLKDATRILERHIFPDLGTRPIGDIQSHELLRVLKGLELKGLRFTARRAKQRCSRVFRHAVGLGYAERDITVSLRGLLEPPRTRHRPGITDPRRLGELLRAIDGYAGREVIGIALKLSLLFFVRPGELRKARWEQFDLERAQWRIPARCMKARVQHLVPLSRQALELLGKLHSLTGDSEYLFPQIRDDGRPLPGTALGCALRALGFSSTEVTPHGFRATACTLLNEMGWRSEAIERQMAHGVSDSVRRHYNYAQHLPERRVMMQAWADYLDDLHSAQNEQTSTALFSRVTSAHVDAEQRCADAPQLSDPQISPTLSPPESGNSSPARRRRVVSLVNCTQPTHGDVTQILSGVCRAMFSKS